uniref:G/T mismatch-specific thymine DNA glycosylase n=1 Tax=Romanomermis culicivorax TaxID=13658 RepID=A0A915HP17_ROMCU
MTAILTCMNQYHLMNVAPLPSTGATPVASNKAHKIHIESSRRARCNGGRGRKLKTEIAEKDEDGKLVQWKITDSFPIVRKRFDRFNGVSEEELHKRCLPDHLASDLDILIIGINPGLFAAYKGHHYAGPGNHFWKCLFLSGLIPEPMTADDDYKLVNHGIGFTNIVPRTTRSSSDLKPQEIKDGADILLEKIRFYKPKIAVFNGKGTSFIAEIYRIFSGRKEFNFGRQNEPLLGTETLVYVMPSSSARCSQLPRASDKVPFYVALRKLRDYVSGRSTLPLRLDEVTFSSVLQTAPRKSDEKPICVTKKSRAKNSKSGKKSDEDQFPQLLPSSTKTPELEFRSIKDEPIDEIDNGSELDDDSDRNLTSVARCNVSEFIDINHLYFTASSSSQHNENEEQSKFKTAIKNELNDSGYDADPLDSFRLEHKDYFTSTTVIPYSSTSAFTEHNTLLPHFSNPNPANLSMTILYAGVESNGGGDAGQYQSVVDAQQQQDDAADSNVVQQQNGATTTAPPVTENNGANGSSTATVASDNQQRTSESTAMTTTPPQQQQQFITVDAAQASLNEDLKNIYASILNSANSNSPNNSNSSPSSLMNNGSVASVVSSTPNGDASHLMQVQPTYATQDLNHSQQQHALLQQQIGDQYLNAHLQQQQLILQQQQQQLHHFAAAAASQPLQQSQFLNGSHHGSGGSESNSPGPKPQAQHLQAPPPLMTQPIQQHRPVAANHKELKPCKLSRDVEIHVDEAIAAVLQRARDGPLPMPVNKEKPKR